MKNEDIKFGKIVVTMTSWLKRINNCVPVLNSILNQKYKADIIYLNLSVDEFPNKENDLPKDLVDLCNGDNQIILNWVEGENTKTMKKVFPILKYLKDDDIIINIDDDALLPKELIQYRLDEFEKYKQPITSCNNPKFHYIDKSLKIWSCGPCSLMQKKMLNNWEVFVNEEIMHSYNDDFTYSIILWLNGYKFYPCTDYSRHSGISVHKIARFNDNDGQLKNHGYINGKEMYILLIKRIKEISNISNLYSTMSYFANKPD